MAENIAYAPSNGNYYAYNNNNIFVSTYGYLYDWPTAINIAPDGWHLPSKEEWQELINCLGGADGAGGKMKEEGNAHWVDPNTGANNSSGFTGLPGGLRDSNGNYNGLNGLGSFWYATAFGSNAAWALKLDKDTETADIYSSNKIYGMSVRCVKD